MMVMAMDNYYTQDHLRELWRKINSLHLSYLELEESPKKLDQRNKLEEYIKDYLCMAPHSQKFYFQETAEVLHRSARSKKDFSGYRAALGWQAVGMYAGNLLSQPWRPEYREIRTYCGFYVHQIDANLVGAEIMFEAMGYKHAGNGIMTLEGPVCPDRVTQVSQDSIVAYMECQILKAIWEEVSNTFKITWLEVLEFREKHLCSPKQAIQALTCRYHQRQYIEQPRSYSQNAELFEDSFRYDQNHPHSHLLLTNHSFPPLSGHSHLPPPPPPPLTATIPTPYLYGMNGCYNYGLYPGIPLQHYQYALQPPQLMKPPYPGNYYYTNGYGTSVPPPACTYPVPTGQLIEVDPQNYDVTDGQVNQVKRQNIIETYKSKTEAESKTKPKNPVHEEGSGTFESWDYVYRNLESQGYSKDLGERGDILSPPLSSDRKHPVKEAKKIKSVDLEEGLVNLNISRPLKVPDSYEKSKNNTERHNSFTQSSSYDNLSSGESVSKATASKSNKTLQREKLLERWNAPSTSKNAKKSKKENCKGKEENWECKTCTFLNEKGKDICVMCGKSRMILSEELEIGGAECSVCTLVNRRDRVNCEACGHNLKNSPTYI